MKFIKIGVVSIFLLFSNANAESYSNVSTVKGMTVGVGFARIQLVSMKAAENCLNSNYYWLDTSQGKEMFSALLAAKASGSELSLQLVGCQGDMPKITHVYICDKPFCS